VTVASRSQIRVRYAETDQMGVAYHGNYLAWFEVGRTDLLRNLGITYKQLETEGLRLPVIGVDARFLRPARYDDVLDIHTRIASCGGARVAFAYSVVLEGEDEPLATGSTSHAAVDPSGRPRRLPQEIRRLLAEGHEIAGADASPGEVTDRRIQTVRQETRRGDMNDTLADATAARQDLGFRSTVALEEGLARERDWIRGKA
jgi:acyl-CoA thioester hydrolase